MIVPIPTTEVPAMKAIPAKIRKSMNTKLHGMGNYHNGIPLGQAFEILKEGGYFPLQEDGTPWEGIICGVEGQEYLPLMDDDGKVAKSVFVFSWYKMPSGRYEFISYVS
ncbi:MAG: hypothetical protein ACWGQW_02050 [bacterium]